MIIKEIKICPIHGECQHTYYPKSGRKGQWRCSKCDTESAILKKRKFKLRCVEYKGGCCEKCGYDKNISALEFHHIDMSQKEFGISTTHKNWDVVKKELDKCILLCANCHREVHNEDATKENLEKIIKERKELFSKIITERNNKKIPFTYDELYTCYKALGTWDKVSKHYNISLATLKRYRNKLTP